MPSAASLCPCAAAWMAWAGGLEQRSACCGSIPSSGSEHGAGPVLLAEPFLHSLHCPLLLSGSLCFTERQGGRPGRTRPEGAHHLSTHLSAVAPSSAFQAGVVLDLFCALNPALKRRQLDAFCWPKLWLGFYLNNAGGQLQVLFYSAVQGARSGGCCAALGGSPPPGAVLWLPLPCCACSTPEPAATHLSSFATRLPSFATRLRISPLCSHPTVHRLHLPDAAHRLERHPLLAGGRQSGARAALAGQSTGSVPAMPGTRSADAAAGRQAAQRCACVLHASLGGMCA